MFTCDTVQAVLAWLQSSPVLWVIGVSHKEKESVLHPEMPGVRGVHSTAPILSEEHGELILGDNLFEVHEEVCDAESCDVEFVVSVVELGCAHACHFIFFKLADEFSIGTLYFLLSVQHSILKTACGTVSFYRLHIC